MNDLERKLLNIVQSKFPIVTRPFYELGLKLGISETDVLNTLRKLKENGIIRRIGGVFDSKKLGYQSCLIATKVPPEKLEETANFINKFPGVTHNYERTHEYNLWFTLAASSDDKFNEIVEIIKENTDIQELILLPAIRIFQSQVKFNM